MPTQSMALTSKFSGRGRQEAMPLARSSKVTKTLSSQGTGKLAPGSSLVICCNAGRQEAP